jgi:hypothetical protein
MKEAEMHNPLEKEACDIIDRIKYLEEAGATKDEIDLERQRLQGTMYGKELEYNDIEEVNYVIHK